MGRRAIERGARRKEIADARHFRKHPPGLHGLMSRNFSAYYAHPLPRMFVRRLRHALRRQHVIINYGLPLRPWLPDVVGFRTFLMSIKMPGEWWQHRWNESHHLGPFVTRQEIASAAQEPHARAITYRFGTRSTHIT